MSDHDTEPTFTEREILQGIGRELRLANQRLETMRNCLVFFVVVTIVGWLMIAAAAVQAD
jgi:hypothetical protein